MSKRSGVKNGTVKQVSRRLRVIDMLTAQLKKSTKVEKKTGKVIPLEEKDITRINKELETLKSRV